MNDESTTDEALITDRFTDSSESATAADAARADDADRTLVSDVLVEEISIDGMCGVY